MYDLRYADRGSNVRSKGIDGFTPLGPALLDARDVDPENIRLRTWVNGDLVQDAITGDDLLFSFADIVADISRLTTLEPGDVILTGTPTGSTVVRPGDLVEVEVSYGPQTTGRLRSPVEEAGYTLSPPGAMPDADDAQRELAYGARGAPGPTDSPAELLAAVGACRTATLASQLRKRGYNSVTLDRLHTTRPAAKMAGFARTLRYVPFREDLFAQYGGTLSGGGMNAQKRAVEQVRPGEILVIEARGDPTAGTVGDILGLRAQIRGAKGIVTDGAIRDSEALAEPRHPCLFRRRPSGGSRADATCRGKPTPRSPAPGSPCSRETSSPATRTASSWCPRHLAMEVARDAAEQELQEQFIAEMVAKGQSVDGLYPIGKKWQAAYQAWLGERERPEREI